MAINHYKPYLIYWVKSITGLEGFFANQKIKIPDNDYFLFSFLSLTFKGMGEYTNPPEGLTTDLDEEEFIVVKHAGELTLKLEIFGEDAFAKLTGVIATLSTNSWNNYLDNSGLGFAKKSKIISFDTFNFTDFIEQAQVNLVFNVSVSLNEIQGSIETVEEELIVN